jgi:hypothetical protein
MGNIFVGANLAIRSATMEINSVERSSSRGASAMSKGKSVCEEFCHQVISGSRIVELNDYTLQEIEEIKCALDIEHFTGLVERMVQEGYCCTQVQRDVKLNHCIAWFEPMTLD